MSEPHLETDDEVVRLVRGYVGPLHRQAAPANLQQNVLERIRSPRRPRLATLAGSGLMLVVIVAVAVVAVAVHGGSGTAGGGWQVMSAPSNLAPSGLSCPSSGDCWAAGGTRVWHYTRGAWSGVSSPGKGTLDAIACVTVGDCWAVGGHFTVPPGANDGVVQPLIEHGGSAGFAMFSGPQVSGDADSLDGVTCVSAADCWAMGTYGANSENGGDGILHPLVEQYDGAGWSVVSSGSPSTVSGQLTAVACADAGECWTVGTASGGSLIERYDGTSWTLETAPGLAQDIALDGVTCVGPDDCWAVGSTGGGDTLQPGVIHYTDGGWAAVSSPHVDAANGGSLADVACCPHSPCSHVATSSRSSSVTQGPGDQVCDGGRPLQERLVSDSADGAMLSLGKSASDLDAAAVQ